MNYDDFPENLNDKVVEKLNDEYDTNKINTSTLDDKEIISKLNIEIAELSLTENISSVLKSLNTCKLYLEEFMKLDRKNNALLCDYISSTTKQMDTIQGLNISSLCYTPTCIPKYHNFHNACKDYSCCELQLIRQLFEICFMCPTNINPICFQELCLMRLKMYTDIFSLYT